jgi:hypothetical protein
VWRMGSDEVRGRWGGGRGGQHEQWGISLAPEWGWGGAGGERGWQGLSEKRGDVGSHRRTSHILGETPTQKTVLLRRWFFFLTDISAIRAKGTKRRGRGQGGPTMTTSAHAGSTDKTRHTGSLAVTGRRDRGRSSTSGMLR